MTMKRFFATLTLVAVLLAAVPEKVQAQWTGQLQVFWTQLSTGALKFTNAAIQASGYLTWGNTVGVNGYGLRDSAGTIQYKNSGGAWVSLPAAGAAPADATYLTQTPNAGLSAEQAMSALATGLVYNTTATGVQTVVVCATANTVLVGGAPPTCTATPTVTTLTASTSVVTPFVNVGTSPYSATGAIRLGYADVIKSRNAANGADVTLLGLVTFGGPTNQVVIDAGGSGAQTGGALTVNGALTAGAGTFTGNVTASTNGTGFIASNTGGYLQLASGQTITAPAVRQVEFSRDATFGVTFDFATANTLKLLRDDNSTPIAVEAGAVTASGLTTASLGLTVTGAQLFANGVKINLSNQAYISGLGGSVIRLADSADNAGTSLKLTSGVAQLLALDGSTDSATFKSNILNATGKFQINGVDGASGAACTVFTFGIGTTCAAPDANYANVVLLPALSDRGLVVLTVDEYQDFMAMRQAWKSSQSR